MSATSVLQLESNRCRRAGNAQVIVVEVVVAVSLVSKAGQATSSQIKSAPYVNIFETCSHIVKDAILVLMHAYLMDID